MNREDIDWDRDDELVKQALENDNNVEVLSFNEDFNLIYDLNFDF